MRDPLEVAVRAGLEEWLELPEIREAREDPARRETRDLLAKLVCRVPAERLAFRASQDRSERLELKGLVGLEDWLDRSELRDRRVHLEISGELEYLELLEQLVQRDQVD